MSPNESQNSCPGQEWSRVKFSQDEHKREGFWPIFILPVLATRRSISSITSSITVLRCVFSGQTKNIFELMMFERLKTKFRSADPE